MIEWHIEKGYTSAFIASTAEEDFRILSLIKITVFSSKIVKNILRNRSMSKL